MAPRFTKQQPQIRSHLTNSSQQPSMSSYDSRQSTNPNFFDDRRVINNSVGLRITVSNNANNNRNNNSNGTNHDQQYSPDTRSLMLFTNKFLIYILFL